LRLNARPDAEGPKLSTADFGTKLKSRSYPPMSAVGRLC
jgi:hypothetical protein